MGLLDRLMKRAIPPSKEATMQDMVTQVVRQGYVSPWMDAKTGEQIAKLSDPHGKRIYHEHFVDEQGGWLARVYYGTSHLEQRGSADTPEQAKQHAVDWAEATRKQLEAQP